MKTNNALSKKMGRPSKLTPKLQENICSIIAQGNYLITACQAVGIGKSTYLLWMERAEKEQNNGGGIYLDFMTAVKKAEAEAEAKLLSVVREKAIDGKEWIPAMTILERRHPDRWGRKDRITDGGAGRGETRVLNIIVIDSETKNLIAQVKERTGNLIETSTNVPSQVVDG